MSEVVEMLESIIDASSPQDECVPETVKEAENMKEETEESEPEKQENNQKKGFDFREMVLRNRSIGKLDWRNWTPGLVRT